MPITTQITSVIAYQTLTISASSQHRTTYELLDNIRDSDNEDFTTTPHHLFAKTSAALFGIATLFSHNEHDSYNQ
jgi:hypothetical protein